MYHFVYHCCVYVFIFIVVAFGVLLWFVCFIVVVTVVDYEGGVDVKLVWGYHHEDDDYYINFVLACIVYQ